MNQNRRRRGKAMIMIVVVGGVLYLGLMVVVYVLQDLFVFPGGRVMDRTPADAPFQWDYEDLYLPAAGETTNAWYVPLARARGVVLFSHGNGGTIADRLESIQVFRELGFSVLIYDYGGYGRSSGRASEQRCYDDIRAAWRHLTEDRGIPAERIVLFGRSLGGGPTAQLATEVVPGAVILESTFLSVPALAQEKFPLVWIKPLMRHRFDNAKKAPQIQCPILVVHSRDDSLIPYRHGLGLFQRANEPKHFLEIRGEHNEGFIVSRLDYVKGLAAFLTPLFPLPDKA